MVEDRNLLGLVWNTRVCKLLLLLLLPKKEPKWKRLKRVLVLIVLAAELTILLAFVCFFYVFSSVAGVQSCSRG